jgi:hypothetical protein
MKKNNSAALLFFTNGWGYKAQLKSRRRENIHARKRDEILVVEDNSIPNINMYLF